MSKQIARQRDRKGAHSPTKHKRRNAMFFVALIVSLSITGVLLAQWRAIGFTASMLSPDSSATPTPTPSTLQKNYSKEYIYVGGRLVAIEEPRTTPIPTPTPTPTPDPVVAETPLVVISQVYGGGGNTGAAYKNDFIELFNRGETTADLTGWTVQYSPAGSSTWQVTQLSGSLAPGKYYLVQQAQGTGGTIDLPTPDAIGNLEIGATSGRVALVDNSNLLSGTCLPTATGIVDFVGYGSSAGCFEGTGPAQAPTNTTAAFRAADGCTDLNDNASDFDPNTPTPRNHDSAPHDCFYPTGSLTVVISEFRTRGPNGGFDEFIELYNKSNNPVDISGWKLKASNNAGAVTTRVTINANTTLPAHGHYLLTNVSSSGYSGTILGNQTYTTGISDDGGIAITTASDIVIDQVGMSNGSAFKESRSLSPLTISADRSYERKTVSPGGSAQDTDDNRSDFKVRTPSDPQR